MIGYATVGSNRLEDAVAFYDALFAELGVGKIMDHPSGGRIYGNSMETPMFGVLAPYNGEPATIGNGTMIALKASSHEQVRRVYARALELGGQDEGAPGWRGEPGSFYGAYFRDLDGNKLCIYRMGP